MNKGYQHFAHISITVPDLDAAVEFYCRILGAEVAYRLGCFDANWSPRQHLAEHGCKLMDGPINLPEGPTVGCRCQYLCDPWGNYIELMEYTHQAYMDETGVRPYGIGD